MEIAVVVQVDGQYESERETGELKYTTPERSPDYVVSTEQFTKSEENVFTINRNKSRFLIFDIHLTA